MTFPELYQSTQALGLHERKQAFEVFLADNPTHVDALNVLALIHMELGEFHFAIELIEKTLKLKPSQQSIYNLGICWMNVEDWPRAISVFTLLNQRFSPTEDSIGALTTALRLNQQANEAASLIESWHKRSGGSVSSYYNLALCFIDTRDFDKVEQACLKALSLDPTHSPTVELLSDHYYRTHRYQSLFSLAEKHNECSAFFKSAEASLKLGRLADAKTYASKLSDTSAEKSLVNAKIARVTGNLGRSRDLLLNIDSNNSLWPEAAYLLSKNPTFSATKSWLDLLRQHQNPSSTHHLLFAIANAADTLQYFDLAATHYLSGQRVLNPTITFDLEMLERKLASEAAKVQRSAAALPTRPDAPRNFFIVGLPRSGTTLAQQILGQHKDIRSLGETLAIPSAADEISKNILDSKQSRVRAIQVLKEQFPDLGTDGALDTSPENLFHLGTLLDLYPNAKIIICRRDPRDNALSMIQNPLSSMFAVSRDPKQLAAFINACNDYIDDVMSHPQIFSLQLEQLTGAPEATIRDLLAFLDLSFDENCLSPEKNQSAVYSPTSESVRQAINRHSEQKWRHYETCLSELFEALNIKK